MVASGDVGMASLGRSWGSQLQSNQLAPISTLASVAGVGLPAYTRITRHGRGPTRRLVDDDEGEGEDRRSIK